MAFPDHGGEPSWWRGMSVSFEFTTAAATESNGGERDDLSSNTSLRLKSKAARTESPALEYLNTKYFGQVCSVYININRR
jgi:hypothetical protein